MLRTHLQELSTLFGLGPTGSEAEVVSEAASSEISVVRDPSEVEFLKAVTQLVSNAKGKAFPTSMPGVQLTLVGMRKPVEDTETEEFEFIAPLVVKYEGKADAAVWAEAEKALEKLFLDAIRTTAEEYMDAPTVKLVRRRKSDPFSDDPRSLTLLRFRVGEPHVQEAQE